MPANSRVGRPVVRAIAGWPAIREGNNVNGSVITRPVITARSPPGGFRGQCIAESTSTARNACRVTARPNARHVPSSRADCRARGRLNCQYDFEFIAV